jgi:MGT family glycosyltransferase
MSRRTIAFFCMSLRGHLHRIRPLVAELSARGMAVHVFTDRQFAEEVESCGARFEDLFAEHAVSDADAVSFPPAFRFVTFAGRFGAELVERTAKLRADLVVYDSFAIIGRLVGHRLGIPYVNVCAGHAAHPARIAELVGQAPRFDLTRECALQARLLSEELGIAHAEPYAWICSPSPFLNVYCEPPEFLDAKERAAFEPVAFFGSVDPARPRGATRQDASFPGQPGALKLYVSLGTINPTRWPQVFDAAIREIAEQLGAMKDVQALISLADAPDPRGALAESVARPNVRVARYVDQWQVLREADVFLTHHGLNSTHEAIYQRVPMVSYACYWDQPRLARKCQQLGLALPLVPRTRDPLPPGCLREALERLRDERAAFAQHLDAARGWEERVISERAEVAERLLALR